MLRASARRALPGAQLATLLDGRRLWLPGVDQGYVSRTLSEQVSVVNNLTVTGSGSNNTKGSWVEIHAGLTKDVYGLNLNILGWPLNRDMLLDIGVGAAGSETVLVSNIQHSSVPAAAYATGCVTIPIFIRRGTRIAMRSQAHVATAAPQIVTHFQHLNPYRRLYRHSETWGANTAVSGGTTVDPGAVANTLGSWTQLVASSSRRMRAFIVCCGNMSNSARSTYSWQFEVGVGGAGSEVAFAKGGLWSQTVNDYVTPQFYGPFWADVPAGSRVSVRSQCSGTDATDRLVYFSVVAFG